MPLFHFNIYDGKPEPDVEGFELANEQQAWGEAVRFFAGLLRDGPDELWTHRRLMLRVTDDSKVELFSLTLSVTDGIASRQGASAAADSTGVSPR